MSHRGVDQSDSTQAVEKKWARRVIQLSQSAFLQIELRCFKNESKKDEEEYKIAYTVERQHFPQTFFN